MKIIIRKVLIFLGILTVAAIFNYFFVVLNNKLFVEDFITEIVKKNAQLYQNEKQFDLILKDEVDNLYYPIYFYLLPIIANLIFYFFLTLLFYKRLFEKKWVFLMFPILLGLLYNSAFFILYFFSVFLGAYVVERRGNGQAAF